jgi:Carboxypeptidase regulatory-like domain
VGRPLSFALVLVCVGSVACGHPEDRPSFASGIAGVIQAGPTCPVERLGSACPDTPLPGVSVKASRTDGWTAQAKTDDRGRFRLPVPPGRYLVTAITKTVPPVAQPVSVEVTEGAFAEVTIEVDTGIR